MRLIDADKAIADIERQFPDAHYPSFYAELIKEQPTIVDAEPILHARGRWRHKGKMMECSSCGLELKSDERYDWMWNFCPHCGADMREADNGEVRRL